MNINLELYRIFYTVAKYENISKATEELYISQPAITQRINNLEKQLNIQLFSRKPSGVKLTDAGKELYSYVKNSIETMNNVESKFDKYLQRNKKDIIKIKSTNSEDNLLLCKTILSFLGKNPEIGVTIDLGTEEEAVNDILNDKVDIIAINDKYKIRNKKIEIIASKRLDLCLYTSKKYLEKCNGVIDIYKHAEELSFILPKSSSLEKIEFNKFCKKYKLNISSTYESDSIDIRNYFVSNGLGIAIGFRQYIEEHLKENNFIEIPFKENVPEYCVNLMVLGERHNDNGILKFIESLKIS